MSEDKGEHFWEKYGLTFTSGMALFSIVVASLQLLPLVNFSVSVRTVLIALLTGAYLFIVVLLLRHLQRTRYYDFRIALTGPPAAGKTVFSLLLYDLLMNNKLPGVEFTAESRSAIATYQAIRGLSQGVWPMATLVGAVDQYDGSLQYRRRVVVDLEIGDSAGEYWLDLSQGSSDTSAYLEYVLSAQAIVHVISVESVVSKEGDALLLSEARDLRLAAGLMKSVKGSNEPLSPLLIVISKMDLVGDIEHDDLMRVFKPDALTASPLYWTEGGRYRERVGLLERLAQGLDQHYASVHFLFASVQSVTAPGVLGQKPLDDILHWIGESATKFRGGSRATGRRLRAAPWLTAR